jgi:hypothetical protein
LKDDNFGGRKMKTAAFFVSNDSQILANIFWNILKKIKILDFCFKISDHAKAVKPKRV